MPRPAIVQEQQLAPRLRVTVVDKSEAASGVISRHSGRFATIPRVISPEGYRKTVLIAGLFLALIVLSGAAVRLSEAGLGCEDWPTCNNDQVVPEWELHGWIEFGNRLISGVVALASCAAVLMAYRRIPRRRDLILWAWGLVAGVAAQVVLGGITVLADLHPMVVAVHFLLSMVLLWNVAVLWVKASPLGREPSSGLPCGQSELVRPGGITKRLRLHGRVTLGLAALALMVGTLVTGTGPHGGDARADRLQLDLQAVARSHSAIVWLLLASSVALAVRVQTNPAITEQAKRTLRILLAAIVAQGAVGYLQYATGVPRLLVELHILGAIVVWLAVVVAYQQIFVDVRVESLVEDIQPVQ